MERTCPSCNNKADGAAHEDGHSVPSDGDYSICVYCGDIARYAEGCTKLISCTTEHLHTLDKEMQSALIIGQADAIVWRETHG